MRAHRLLHGRRLATAVAMILGGLLLQAGTPRRADAGPWATYGVGSRAIGLSGALAATVDDWTSIFYNPAGLARGEHSTAGMGYIIANHELSIDGERQDVEQLAGPFFGASMKFSERLGMGFGLTLPGSVLKLQVRPPDDPRFFIYDNLVQRLELMGGLGVKVTDRLTIGAGFQFLVDAPIALGLDIKLPRRQGGGSEEYSTFDISLDLQPRLSSTLGLQLAATDRLSLGAAFRDEISIDITLPISIKIDVAGVPIDVPVLVEARCFVTPRQIVGGGAYALSEDLSLALDVTWTEWSAWYDPRGIVKNLPTTGPEIPLADLFATYPDPGFHDTFVPRLGLAWQPFERLGMQVGYRFEPSPAPEQGGELNLVDNDKHVLSAAAQVDLGGGGLLAVPARVGVYGDYHYLVDRTHSKSDPSDPVGSYSSSGRVVQAGLDVTFRF
ncbi:MAG: outer membrane protein transport protein [Candidatus Schekmanbacteria bacterium]|nr:outer membrane protein transport protein [Candidatus Schekmanbacteria bacterium]